MKKTKHEEYFIKTNTDKIFKKVSMSEYKRFQEMAGLFLGDQLLPSFCSADEDIRGYSIIKK